MLWNQTYFVKPLLMLSSAVVLEIGLPGCAAFEANQKCAGADCKADAQITAAVQTSIDQHAELGPPGQLQVETLNRVVYLYGTVSNDLQLAVAKSVALEASGDAKIVNSIAVSEK
jgi:osmotically-inducible protein OsmY